MIDCYENCESCQGFREYPTSQLVKDVIQINKEVNADEDSEDRKGGENGSRLLDRNAKDLAERICQQIDEEAVYGHVSGKWYYEKVLHYIQTINNLKEQSESEK